MKTFWFWFIGCGIVAAIACLLLVAGGFYVFLSPHVSQSAGFVGNSAQAQAVTLSQSLPASATQVRYGRSSVGMGGRLLLYRFTAPVADLHAHALSEFAILGANPQWKQTPNAPSPFTITDIAGYKSHFGLDSSWMLPPAGAIGTIYTSANGQRSHRPTIFVDETNGVLYFEMSD